MRLGGSSHCRPGHRGDVAYSTTAGFTFPVVGLVTGFAGVYTHPVHRWAVRPRASLGTAGHCPRLDDSYSFFFFPLSGMPETHSTSDDIGGCSRWKFFLASAGFATHALLQFVSPTSGFPGAWTPCAILRPFYAFLGAIPACGCSALSRARGNPSTFRLIRDVLPQRKKEKSETTIEKTISERSGP